VWVVTRFLCLVWSLFYSTLLFSSLHVSEIHLTTQEVRNWEKQKKINPVTRRSWCKPSSCVLCNEKHNETHAYTCTVHVHTQSSYMCITLFFCAQIFKLYIREGGVCVCVCVCLCVCLCVCVCVLMSVYIFWLLYLLAYFCFFAFPIAKRSLILCSSHVS
jgi:hypothetical protein